MTKKRHPNRDGTQHHRGVGGIGVIDADDEKPLIDKVTEQTHANERQPIFFRDAEGFAAIDENNPDDGGSKNETDTVETHGINFGQGTFYDRKVKSPDKGT